MDLKDPMRQDIRNIGWWLHDIKQSFSTLNFLLAWIAIELTLITAVQLGFFS
jgi:hypothetical protein